MIDKDKFSSALKEQFLAYLDYCESYLAQLSYNRRVSQLYSFDQFLVGSQYAFNEPINESLVNEWIKGFNGSADQTIMTYVNSLRQFLRFTEKTTDIPVYIPPLRKVNDDYVPYIFSDSEMSAIYSIVDNFIPGPTNTLTYITIEYPLIIRLLASCGFRISELITMQRKDVDFNECTFLMINTKGERQRRVPLTEKMMSMVKTYCKAIHVPNKLDAYLFPRHDFSEPLTRGDIGSRFRDTLVQAGIRKPGNTNHKRGPCLHCLRHRFVLLAIKQLLKADIRLEDTIPYLSIFLGHDDLTETEKYLKFYADLFPEELEKFFGSSDGMYPDSDIWDDWM